MIADPIEKRFASARGDLCYFEWGDPSDQTILLFHATGFHARCWDGVIAALPRNHHVIAVDLPGHGRSARPDSLADWNATAAPLVDLVTGLNLEHLIGVGHSMGGYCLVHAAAALPDRFQRLTLVDPVIMAPDYYDSSVKPEDIDASDHPIARRRAHWDSPEHMYDRMKGHPSYGSWKPEILMDYCEHGLLPRTEGEGFELACPPALEASVYMGSLCSDPYPLLDELSMPITLLRAPPLVRDGPIDFTKSPTWENLAATLPTATEVYLPDLNHFMPMQAPEQVAHYIVPASAKQP